MTLEQATAAGFDALGGGGEERAAAQLETLLAAQPRSASGWQALGLLRRALEQSEPALGALGRAAQLAPGDGRIANALAQVRLEAGLDAVAAFEHALRLAPSAQVIQGLAAALVAAGRSSEAISLLDRTLAANPQWWEGQRLLSRLRWMAGDRGGHLAALDRALAANPGDEALWRVRVAIQLNALHFAELRESLPRARDALGNRGFLTAAEATALSELGRVGEAEELLARLPPPADLTEAIYRIRHHLRCGRPAEAAALAEPLTAQAGVHAWPYMAVAWRLLGDPRWEWLEGQDGLVGVYDLAPRLPSLSALAERLRGIHARSAEPMEQSLRGGSQTDGPLFARIEPEIVALRRVIVEAVEEHVAQLPPRDPRHPQLAARRDRPVRFAGAWSVRLNGGGFHVNHVHPEGWLSSAFYVALPDEVGRGDAGQAGWLALGAPDTALGVDLPALRTVEPKPGRLVLFPSTMWHGTRPFGAGERLTVAFDVARPPD